MNIPVNIHDLLFILVPAGIAAISRPTWSANAKLVLTVVACFLAALAEVILTGQAQVAQMGVVLSKAFFLTMTAYAAFWKGLAPQWLDYLETQVNPGPGGPPAPTKVIPAEFPGQDVGGPGVGS